MSEPGLSHVPGILLKTAARLVARVILILLGCTLLLCVALAYLSFVLYTFRAPRSSRVQSAVELITAAVKLVRSYRK